MPHPFEKKIPAWAAIDGLMVPPSLSLEQCSGEVAARYKVELVRALQARGCLGHARMTDLTGGLGVDFAFLSPCFDAATYVERQEVLCTIARHNFPLLGLTHAEVCCGEAANHLPTLAPQDLIYIDPARRDGLGRKTWLIEDCTPDITNMLLPMLERARLVMVKLSPMLDITRALRSLPVAPHEVHIVAVGGECKELLFLFLSPQTAETAPQTAESSPQTVEAVAGDALQGPLMVCHDGPHQFAFRPEEEAAALSPLAEAVDAYLFEPCAAVMKGGAFRLVGARFGLRKLHANTHLYTADHPVEGFPGRQFRVRTVSSFSKRDVRALLRETDRANLAVRNFPGTVAELRKRFRLKDGGTDYWFATTLRDERHVLIVTEKI